MRLMKNGQFFHAKTCPNRLLFFLRVESNIATYAYLLIVILVQYATAQKDCSQAPTPAMRTLCEQLHRWDKNARASPPVTGKVAKPPAIPGLPEGMAAELAPVAATPYQCMDLGCLCSYMGGNGQQGSNACTLSNGRPLQKAVRKEYRLLTDEERGRFHAAMKSIKQSGEYDRLAQIHAQFASAGGAHGGPSFLGWHREFVKRLEIALRQVDPSVAIPFWDSTIDGRLPTPADSHMFTTAFIGSTDTAGNLVEGDFAGWRTLAGRPNVLRQVGAQGKLFSESEIQWFVGQTDINYVLAFTAPQQSCQVESSFNVLEYTHGNIHLFIGGDMGDQSTAANDPCFWLLHSFVDMIWEIWRLTKDRNTRETLYPLDNQQCASPQHFGSALMSPFEPWRNIDGSHNKYTDNMYEYGPRPSCSMGPNCGSKYLFCSGGQCLAKVRIGGNCQGLSGDVCLGGQCQGGRCVQTAPTPPPPPPKPPAPPGGGPTKKPLPSVACYNEHECCSVWSTKGECGRNPQYMKSWCKPSCGVCQPNYNLQTACDNRHPNCQKWANSGECQKNKFWMSENCRQACGRCVFPRQQICSGGAGKETVTVPPPPDTASKCTSPGCFNENICCQLWGFEGECSHNPIWMQCNCRVSCGKCIPQEYAYGACADYHPGCQRWAMSGECQKNGWMLENCKASCQTCLSLPELHQMCQNSRHGGGGSGWNGGRDMHRRMLNANRISALSHRQRWHRSAMQLARSPPGASSSSSFLLRTVREPDVGSIAAASANSGNTSPIIRKNRSVYVQSLIDGEIFLPKSHGLPSPIASEVANTE